MIKEGKQKFSGEFPPSPLFFNRTKLVLDLAYGDVGPQTPSFFCLPKRNQKGIPQTPERLTTGL
jgi:hypothetical protein